MRSIHVPERTLRNIANFEPRVVFDVDGTLVDTERLVREAYDSVGIAMPDSAFGTSWQEWLTPLCGDSVDEARLVNERKMIAYLRMLEECPPPELPGAVVVRALLAARWNVGFVTNARLQPTLRILEQLSFPSSLLLGVEKDTQGKKAILRVLSGVGRERYGRLGIGGVYLDDKPSLGLQVVRYTGWRFVHAPPSGICGPMTLLVRVVNQFVEAQMDEKDVVWTP